MVVGPEAEASDSNSRLKHDSGPEAVQRLKTGWGSPEPGNDPSACAAYVKPGFDWTNSDAYLFDIDGTLLNSRDAVHYHAFHQAVSRMFGRELRLDGIPVHGNTDVGILRAYLEASEIPENDWRDRIPEVLTIMGDEVERNAADLRPDVCPAIPELIQHLRAEGKLLGVASGNIERVGWAKLKACGLLDNFSFGAFSGELEKREDVIAHGIQQARAKCGGNISVCVVGDTPADIRAAHANGIAAIAVATGIYRFDELRAHDPEMCISCCKDLLLQ